MMFSKLPTTSSLLLLFLTAVATMTSTADAIVVGSRFCLEGIIMDVNSIEDGILNDNAAVTQQPIACLIGDDTDCSTSPYEILLDPKSSTTTTKYTRGFRLSAMAKSRVISVAKAAETSGETTGFRAALVSTVIDLGSDTMPPMIEVSTAVDSTTPGPNYCGALGAPNFVQTYPDYVGLSGDDMSDSTTTTTGGEGMGDETVATTTQDEADSTATTPAPDAAAAGGSTLAVGQTFCVEGFVMDFFCIDRGTLADAPEIVSLEQPDVHSLHCLLDVNSCLISPYEVLIDPIDGSGDLFSRGWRLSDAAKDLALAEGRRVGICDNCDGGGDLEFGFRGVMDATIVDLGDGDTIPITIDVTQVIASNGLADPCAQVGLPNILDTVDPATFAITSGGGSRPVILAHGTLMMVSWGLLLPSGVIIAKFLKHRPNGLWFRIHQPLQICGLVMALTGWIIALVNFNVFGDKGMANFYHGIMGCTVMTIGLLQPINAFFRPHAPEPGEETPLPRLLWEVLHKSAGWIAILLAVATISLGTTLLPMVDDQKTYQLTYGIGCGGILFLLIAYICYDKSNFRGSEGHVPVKTHDDMEGRKYHS